MRFAPPNVQTIVVDIEGTTTPIAFVHERLFAFARRHLRTYLDDPRNREALREPIARLMEEWAADSDLGPAEAGRHARDHALDGLFKAGCHVRDDAPDGPVGGERHVRVRPDEQRLCAYVERLMDQDRKSPGLKLLQGQIWEEGYRRGELRGEVFDDVPTALRRWRGAGLTAAVYSSGSELAQRLLFQTTAHGDLTQLFVRFFDTAVGAKTSADSYRRIARELERPANRMLFVSDVTTELDAARAAGWQTVLCVRPGNIPQPPHDYAIVERFDDIVL